MKVLVTGATGFTGNHLARFLRREGDDVRAFVRNVSKATDLSDEGIEVVQGDLTDRASLGRAMNGIEVVYNVAALFRAAGLPAAGRLPG